MAGLIEKDIRLILQRKQALVLFLVIALFMGFTMDGTFIVGYLPFLCIVLTVGTLSYDEFDNGLQFLMTLPITVQSYVKEKFVFVLGSGFITWILSLVLYVVVNSIKGIEIVLKEDLAPALLVLCFMMIIASALLYFQIKFGAEKSRIVFMVTGGIIFAIGYAMIEIVPAEVVSNIVFFIDTIHPLILLAIIMLFTLCIVFIALLASIQSLNKKEL